MLLELTVDSADAVQYAESVALRTRSAPVLTTIVLVLALCAACRSTPPSPPMPRIAVPSIEPGVLPPQPKPKPTRLVKASCDPGPKYPWPRLIEQVLTDVPPEKRRARSSFRAGMAIDREGKITRLRFFDLSTSDTVNRKLIESVGQWKIQPTVLNGEKVEVSSCMDILIHYNSAPPVATAHAHAQAISEGLRLLAPQSGVRVDAARPPGRKITGQERDQRQKTDGGREDHRIGGAHVHQKATGCPGDRGGG